VPHETPCVRSTARDPAEHRDQWKAVGSIIAAIMSTYAPACSKAGTTMSPCGIARHSAASAPASPQPPCSVAPVGTRTPESARSTLRQPSSARQQPDERAAAIAAAEGRRHGSGRRHDTLRAARLDPSLEGPRYGAGTRTCFAARCGP
jgi:hypothetical protein